MATLQEVIEELRGMQDDLAQLIQRLDDREKQYQQQKGEEDAGL